MSSLPPLKSVFGIAASYSLGSTLSCSVYPHTNFRHIHCCIADLCIKAAKPPDLNLMVIILLILISPMTSYYPMITEENFYIIATSLINLPQTRKKSSKILRLNSQQPNLMTMMKLI